MVTATISNKEIAGVLEHIAELLEVQKANPHRIRAYRNGAMQIRKSKKELAEIAEAGGRKLDAMKRGGGAAGLRLSRLKKVRSTRLPLKPTGSRWRALFWQTLVAEWRVGTWKLATTL